MNLLNIFFWIILIQSIFFNDLRAQKIKKKDVIMIEDKMLEALSYLRGFHNRRPKCFGDPSEPNYHLTFKVQEGKKLITETCVVNRVTHVIYKQIVFQLGDKYAQGGSFENEEEELKSKSQTSSYVAPCTTHVDEFNSALEHNIALSLEKISQTGANPQETSETISRINIIINNNKNAIDDLTPTSDREDAHYKELIKKHTEKISYYEKLKQNLVDGVAVIETPKEVYNREETAKYQMSRLSKQTQPNSPEQAQVELVIINSDGSKSKTTKSANEAVFMGREVLFSSGHQVSEKESRAQIVLLGQMAGLKIENALLDKYAKEFSQRGLVLMDKEEAELFLAIQKIEKNNELKFNVALARKIMQAKYARMFDQTMLAEYSVEKDSDDYGRAFPEKFSWFALGGGVWGQVAVEGESRAKSLVSKPSWWAKHFEKMDEPVQPLPEKYYGLAQMSVPEREIIQNMGFDPSKVFSRNYFDDYRLKPKSPAEDPKTSTNPQAVTAQAPQAAEGQTQTTKRISPESASSKNAQQIRASRVPASTSSAAVENSQRDDDQSLSANESAKKTTAKIPPIELGYFAWVYSNRYEPIANGIAYQKGSLLKKEVVFDLEKSVPGKENHEVTAVAREVLGIEQNYFYLKNQNHKIMMLYDPEQRRFRPEFGGPKDRKFWQKIKDHPFCQGLTYQTEKN